MREREKECKGSIKEENVSLQIKVEKFLKCIAHTPLTYLTTVRSSAERASLWKVMTTLEAGSSDFHCLCLQLNKRRRRIN